jgi:hypothetical protein
MISVHEAEKPGLQHIEKFILAAKEVRFEAGQRAEVYGWMERLLCRQARELGGSVSESNRPSAAQSCRALVLKTRRITGPHALPFGSRRRLAGCRRERDQLSVSVARAGAPDKIGSRPRASSVWPSEGELRRQLNAAWAAATQEGIERPHIGRGGDRKLSGPMYLAWLWMVQHLGQRPKP